MRGGRARAKWGRDSVKLLEVKLLVGCSSVQQEPVFEAQLPDIQKDFTYEER